MQSLNGRLCAPMLLDQTSTFSALGNTRGEQGLVLYICTVQEECHHYLQLFQWKPYERRFQARQGSAILELGHSGSQFVRTWPNCLYNQIALKALCVSL